jgi:hypothetical protein
MQTQRLLTLGPDNDPLWVGLYIRQIDEVWAAMIVADTVTPPKPGELKGLGFIAETAEEAGQQAKAYLGASEPAN